jgi:creatinine amidohydrolase
VRKETFRNIIVDLLHCLHRWGFSRIFLINWHGDKEHILTLIDAIKQARINLGVRCYILLTEFEIKRLNISYPQPFLISVGEDPSEGDIIDIHAGSDEVSIILNYFPDHVNEVLASRLVPTNLTQNDIRIWNRGWKDTRNMIPEGFFGNPSEFSKDKGKKIIDMKSKRFAKQISDFLKKN